MPIENSRQIVRELMKDTESRKIKWWNIVDSEWELIFRYERKVTENKSIKYDLKCKREKFQSDLTITFGPIVERLSGSGTLIHTKLVSVITPRVQPLLIDLIDQLRRKYEEGDINHLRLRESKMNEFHSENQDVKERQDKLKNIKLLTTVCKHTDEGILKWEINYQDDEVAVFISTHQITKNKSLVFTVKCSETSDKKEYNIFRSILKTANTSGVISHNVQVIHSLSLKEYPSLIILIKKLCKKMINKDFNRFVEKPKKTQLDLFNKNSVAVTAKNEEDYKKYTLDVIRFMLKDQKIMLDENIWAEIYEIYDKVKKAKTYDEMNDLLYKAHMISIGKSDITHS
jgi:hypothetical protein